MDTDKAMKKKTFIIEPGAAGYPPFIRLSAAQARPLTANGNKRVVCLLNGTLTLHAALQRMKTGDYFIIVSLKNLRALKLKAGDAVQAEIRVDDSELQFHVPEEFAEVMATDPAAKALFDGLTAGNKRGLIALVNMVKSTDKKIERALLIAEKLKRGIHSPQLVMKKI